jgi:hypothetical protein
MLIFIHLVGIITEPMFLEVFPQMEPTNKSGAIQALVVAIYEVGCLVCRIVVKMIWKCILIPRRWERWA